MDPKNSQSFRLDINGLRALAVIAVVLFHFEVPGFTGGFIGVDVFFVISGFLMTGIVIKGLEQNQFSLIDFYTSRARRIIPALVFMCAILLVLGWAFLLNPDYKTLSSHIVYSLLFASNIEYWLESGYFAAASHEKWLLHTWSLSVEWQFYLLLPIITLIAWKIKSGRIPQFLALASILVASFIASVFTTQTDQSGAFFLLHTRAWEMLAGSLVFLATPFFPTSHIARLWTNKIGILLIGLSIVIFNPDSKWPGWIAVTPVVGAMFVIIANHTSRLTGSTLTQWLGDRSYSIYLWHWPICVTLTYFDIQDNPLITTLAIFISTALGHASYVWVENKFRQRNTKTGRKKEIFGLGLFCLSVAGSAVAVWKLNGISGRFNTAIEVAAGEAENIPPRRGECHPNKGPSTPSCVHGTGDRKIILIGDSHANAIVAALSSAGSKNGYSVIEWTYSACNFVPGIKKTNSELKKYKDYQCTNFINWIQSQLETLPSDIPVVIANRYAVEAFGPNEARHPKPIPNVYFSKQYETTNAEFIQEFSNHIIDGACKLAKNRTVFMIRPIPEIGVNVPNKLSRRMIFGENKDIYIPLTDYMKRNSWVWDAQNTARDRCGVKIVDPTSLLCSDGRCYGSMRMRPLYYDDDHLSGFGNQIVTPIFLDIFNSMRNPDKSSTSGEA